MQALAGIATLSFIVVAGVIGTRLLLMARRTRQLPELSIGLALLLVVFLGYPLSLASSRPGLDLSLARLLYGGGLLVTAVGSAFIFVFTCNVFRSGVAWARGLAGIAILSLAVLTGIGLVQAARSSAPAELIADPISLLRHALQGTGYLWTAIESLRYRGMLQRRRALGLGDPVVSNRILLWAVSGTSATIGIAVPLAIMLLDPSASHYNAASMLTIALAGLTASASTYLAFLPPASWLRWVEGGAGAPSA